MPKRSYPLFEPRQVFARHPMMQWARFGEGNPEPVAPPAAAPVPPEPTVPPKPADPPKVPDVTPEQVAEMRQKLADFEAAEQKRADEAQAKADAELSELEKANRAIAELTIRNARNEALAAHPVPAEYQSLVQGTDAASFLASAKLASELAAKAAGIVPPPPKPDPIPGSGTQPPGGAGSGPGSISELRQQIADRKKK